ncbi:hypothetical protein [Sorangium sp. So ce385]|uniref:hypothetical protein n=1 Tax=Sorangium sp. So ce385 TaxID=3133308 RepID=UPI003F5B0ADC
MFALGVYAVETGLPGLAERSRDALPANMAASDPASVTTAASNTAAAQQADAPVQLTAQPPPSATDAAAQAAPPPPPAAPPPQPSPEAPPAPPPQPSPEAATPPPQPPAIQAEASVPRNPRRGYGFLKLNASQNATVYVTGVAVGPSNQPIEVRCGRFFVRLGEPTRNGTRWLAEGRTVRIKCGALTEAAF